VIFIHEGKLLQRATFLLVLKEKEMTEENPPITPPDGTGEK
jgi:hypothetical protein